MSIPERLLSNIKLQAEPKDDLHVVNKKFVVDYIGGKIKDSVRVVEGSNLNMTYDKPSMKLTQSLGAAFIVDGVTLDIDDRLLLIGQTDATQNGIYTVTKLGIDGTPAQSSHSLGGSNTGLTDLSKVTFSSSYYIQHFTNANTLTYDGADWKAGGSTITLGDYGITIDPSETPATSDTIEISYTAPVGGTKGELTRADDFNSSSSIKSNVRIPVSQGDANKDTSYVLTTDGVITLDTTPLEFVKFSAKKGIDKAIGTFTGDGTAKEFVITHGLNTSTPCVITIYDKDNCIVGANVKATSNNTIKISTDVALETTDGTFTVVITA